MMPDYVVQCGDEYYLSLRECVSAILSQRERSISATVSKSAERKMMEPSPRMTMVAAERAMTANEQNINIVQTVLSVTRP